MTALVGSHPTPLLEVLNMTVKGLVSELIKKGYNVTYRVRKDGGILITSIDSHKYKGATGNRVARMLLGQDISERRKAQLTKITRQRVRHPRKLVIETPEDLERYRKRVMRKWRKANLTGSISKRNLRKIIEDRGIKDAETYLMEMERHTQGKAYFGAIEGLLAKIQNDIDIITDSIDIDNLQQAYNLIEQNKEDFKQEWLFPLFDELYNFEKGISSSSAFLIKVESLINS